MTTHTRPRARAPGGLLLLLGLGLLLPPALVPAEAAAALEERDAICQGYRGTALWGKCTRAVGNGSHESEPAHPRCETWEAQWEAQTDTMPPWLLACGGFIQMRLCHQSCNYTGDLVREANARLGTGFTVDRGLVAAYALCQALASAEGSLAAPGTYKDCLSYDTALPGRSRVHLIATALPA